MNSSTVSVYDNVKTPDSLSDTCLYGALNDSLKVNDNFENQLFCPLCISSFNYKFSLIGHLRRFHSNFLTQVNGQTIKFKVCPFCRAKFYGKHLTAKHVLHHHYIFIKELYVTSDKFECTFCNVKLSEENSLKNLKHIEELHFVDFTEDLKKRFLNKTVKEFVFPTSEYFNSQLTQAADQKVELKTVGTHSTIGINTNIIDFDEASKINCYDFTDLKQQLENLKDVQNCIPNFHWKSTSPNKSILKDIMNSPKVHKSVRRVLRFDLPSGNEDKENSVFNQTLYDFKEINAEELNLCSDNKSEKCNFIICDEPLRCSTPNSTIVKTASHQGEKKNTLHHSGHLKSEKSIRKSRNKIKTQKKKGTEFDFQCGKCRLLFRENFELVFHVKNNHKKFTLNALWPCYYCAICDAKFYRNYYLKKHHNLHKST